MKWGDIIEERGGGSIKKKEISYSYYLNERRCVVRITQWLLPLQNREWWWWHTDQGMFKHKIGSVRQMNLSYTTQMFNRNNRVQLNNNNTTTGLEWRSNEMCSLLLCYSHQIRFIHISQQVRGVMTFKDGIIHYNSVGNNDKNIEDDRYPVVK